MYTPPRTESQIGRDAAENLDKAAQYFCLFLADMFLLTKIALKKAFKATIDWGKKVYEDAEREEHRHG